MPNRISPLRSTALALLLAASLAACNKSPKHEDVAPPEPASVPAPSDATPAPGAESPPTETPASPAQPEATPPPPAEPSAVPKPTASREPSVDTMLAARPSAKISVAADVLYQFDGEPLANQPVTLHLAAVPRVAGSKLRVSIKSADGLQVAAGPLEVEKASAGGVYRQNLSITRSATGPQDLRVLVTMDMGEGTAFGYFSIPMVAGTTAQKLDSVKER
jgi:hypothetical protein